MKFPDDAPVTRSKRDALNERITRLRIDLNAVDEQAIRAGGPGGQKTNKTSSGVLLRYPVRSGRAPSLQGEARTELIIVKWTRERQRSLNRFLALRELIDEIERRVSPQTSARLREEARIRKQKDRRRRR